VARGDRALSRFIDALEPRREAVAMLDELMHDVAEPKNSGVFNRIVAVAIVLTTLAAAGVEWMRSSAEDEEGRASRAAQVYAMAASAQQWRDTQNANSDIASFSLASDDRALAYWSVQKILFSRPSDSAPLRRELDRYTALANKAAGAGDFPAGVYGPDADPQYPQAFYAENQVRADVIAAQQDAQNVNRAEWAENAAGYTAMLAVLAVAVYLLGLSLTLAVRIRYYLAGLGVALFLLSSTWAGVSQIRSPLENAGSDQLAAEAYAAGMLSMRTAYLHEGVTGYTDAIKHFKDAIRLRPNFARAYLGLGEAEFGEGSPQRNTLYTSVTDQAHLERSTADLRKAVDLHLPQAHLDLAFDEYLLAIPNQGGPPDVSLLKQSIQDSQESIAADPHETVAYYNLALATLAGGLPGATDAYERAVKQTPASDEDVAGGAITDLTDLGERQPRLADQIQKIKQIIIAGVWSGAGRERLRGPVQIKTFYRYSRGLQVQFDAPGFDPEGGAFNFQFYYQQGTGTPWAVMPSISGELTASRDSTGGPDSYYVFADYLREASDCLPTGNFRVEMYLNSQLSATSVANDDPSGTAWRDLQYTSFRDIRIRVCRPGDWQPASLGANFGFIKGYASTSSSPDSSCAAVNRCGFYVVRYQFPSIRAADGLIFSEVTASFLSDENAFPAKLVSTTPLQPLGNHWFEGMQAGYADEWYEYEGGYVLAVSGMMDDNSMIVGLVYGPKSFFDSSRAYRVYESFISVT